MSDATAALIRAVIENMKGAHDDWVSLAMVIDAARWKVTPANIDQLAEELRPHVD